MPRNAMTRGPRDEPPIALRTGPAGRVTSHPAPRDRRPAAGTAPTGTSLRADAAEDPFTPWTDSPRRHTDPPYRRSGAAPSTTPERHSAEPAPAPPAVSATPAPPAAPAPPQVLVVRAPAAPTGEAAYWERRHLGRMLRGVVR